MTNIKKWLIYAVFCTAVLILLLYYLFPSESVARYVVAKANQRFPDLRVSIGRVRPTFPPGLSFAPVRIAYNDFLLIETEVIRIFPRLRSVFGPSRIFFFSLPTRDGLLKGRVNFISGNPNKPPAFEIAISGIQLAEIPLIRDQSDFKLSGLLKLDMRWENRSEIGPEIRARIEAFNCELQVQTPLLLQDRFIFSRIAADLHMSGNRVELNEFDFTGDFLDGRIAGHGILQYPLNKSKIDLSAQISPQAQFFKGPGGKLPDTIVNMIKSGGGDTTVLIQGTIEKPSFSFY